MDERQLHELLNRAAAADDPATWVDATRAFARVGRTVDLPPHLDAAASRGVDVEPLREALEPPDLASFEMRRMQAGEVAHLGGRLDHAAWDPGGNRLFLVQDRRRVLEWDVRTEEVRLVGEVPKEHTKKGREKVGAIGRVPGEETLAVVLTFGDVSWKDPTDVTFMALADGALPKQPPFTTKNLGLAVHPGPPGVVLVEQNTRVEAFRVGGKGAACWSFTSPLLGVGRRVVGLKRGHLEAVDPMGKKPEKVFPLESAFKKKHRRLFAAARDRVVLRDGKGNAVLHGPDGPEGKARLPKDYLGYLVPSPSGRYVALQVWGEHTEVLDLRTGESRRFEIGARVNRPEWSPDGALLVVPTSAGDLVLLGGRGEVRASEAPAETDSDWVELRKKDRFWRARVQENILEARWGEVGSGGTYKATEFPTPAKAERSLAQRVKAQRKKGYRPA